MSYAKNIIVDKKELYKILDSAISEIKLSQRAIYSDSNAKAIDILEKALKRFKCLMGEENA